MSEYTPIDLSSLPPPDAVETVSFQALFEEMLASLQERDPAFTALTPSDPTWVALEVAAEFRMKDRQRINDGVRAVMLAYAKGADLEQIAALFGVTRLTMDPGDPEALPPVPPTYETDTALRYRTQLALESLSTAGPVGAYKYHAMSVQGVKDAGIQGPPDTDPGEVLVTILSADGNGEAAPEVISSVANALNKDTVRPLTDQVSVQSAEIHEYKIIATLFIGEGPDPDLVKQSSQAAVAAFAAERHRVGANIRLAGLYDALVVAGVENVTFSAPGIVADFVATASQAPYCTEITLSTAPA